MLDFSFFQSSYGVIFDVMDKKKTFNQTIKTELNEIESLIRLFYSYCICEISFVTNISTVVQCITKNISWIFFFKIYFFLYMLISKKIWLMRIHYLTVIDDKHITYKSNETKQNEIKIA